VRNNGQDLVLTRFICYIFISIHMYPFIWPPSLLMVMGLVPIPSPLPPC
jgi:hypothetical protein